MDSISTQRGLLLYPELWRRWVIVEAGLTEAGFISRIVRGLASASDQTALWQKGRNPDGSYIDPIHHTGVVTYAKAGQSYHNYGLALDWVPMTPGGLPIWDAAHPAYAKGIELAEAQGLFSGACWHLEKKDTPHIQLVGNFFQDEPDDNLRYIFDGGGMRAVWEQVDKDLGIAA